MYRYTTPGLFTKLDPFLEWKVTAAKESAVYLTFDDGPHPEITPWVLDLLARYQIKATFFCVGENVRKYPEVYRRIVQEGHAVGNHTHLHLNGWKNSFRKYVTDVELASSFIHSNLFRPPYGKIGPRQAWFLKRKGYRIIMWSLLSRDFEANLDRKEALNRLLNNTYNGSIIVFHDSAKAEENLKTILPEYIDGVLEKGFKMKEL